MIRIIVFILLFLNGISGLVAQNPNLGIPFIEAYPKDIYQSGTLNWDIRQDRHGLMYFANNNGLMYFDGSLWKTYPLPNATIVRSVAISDENEIYVGGQNEIGKFIPNKAGTLSFQSLKHLIPQKHRSFEDVWEIVFVDGGIFFRASNKLYQIKDGQCIVYDDLGIQFLGKSDGQGVVQDLNAGLFYFEEGALIKVEGSEQLNGKLISEILTAEEHTVIATQDDGLFILENGRIRSWSTDADDFFRQNHITSAARAASGQLAFGTDFAGVLIMGSDGKGQVHINRSKGLLNNKVFSVFFDKKQNLWLGVDNGINYVEVNSPFSQIYPDGSLEGAGFATKIFEDRIYFGTSNGLYVADWRMRYDPLNPVGFDLINNTKGQNWGLDIVGEELLLGHNNGIFSIKEKTAKFIYDEAGGWNFASLTKDDDYAIGGTYKNFALFKKENNQWTFANDFDGWFESSRFVEQDMEGNIWMSHPYKGVFKIRLTKDLKNIEVKKYGPEFGLPSDIQNHLFKIKEEIIYCGEQGVFRYDATEDQFSPYDRFNEIFGSATKIRRFFEAPNGNIWFISDIIGILKIEDRGLDKKIINKQVFPQFNKQLNPGFESIYPYDDKNVFITNDRGFIHYNPSFQNKADTTFEVILNEVRLTAGKDSLIFAGHRSDSTDFFEFKAQENALHFGFSGTDYAGTKYLRYRYFLEGFDKDWLDWTALNLKEYTNLPPGEYTFKVQAQNQHQVISSTAEYTFRILAPWYASKIAYLIYGLLAIFAFAFVVRAYQKKYYGLKEDHDQNIKASEKVIGQLKEEKVKAELEYKQRELASTAMHVVQKNETLGKVKKELLTLKKMNTDKLLSKEIQKLINMLQQDEIIDDGWEQFMFHFNQLHGDFYNRLKSKYSDLTPKDLKLCTYLRMNLSTKEMASLLNVTTRGIEASRYRLRKKVQLDKEENLTAFLMSF